MCITFLLNFSEIHRYTCYIFFVIFRLANDNFNCLFNFKAQEQQQELTLNLENKTEELNTVNNKLQEAQEGNICFTVNSCLEQL